MTLSIGSLVGPLVRRSVGPSVGSSSYCLCQNCFAPGVLAPGLGYPCFLLQQYGQKIEVDTLKTSAIISKRLELKDHDWSTFLDLIKLFPDLTSFYRFV
jgi:hypothetical protein